MPEMELMRRMDIASYLENKRDHFGQTSSKVKDFSVFDYNYIPEKPVERAEVKEIVKQMVRFEMTGIPAHMSIVGSRGSGKTLMLKYLQHMVSRKTELDVLYVNCRHHNTSFKIFAHLLGQPKTGGCSLDDLYQRFLAKEIYDRYCRFSRDQQIKPFSYMYFYTNLGYLQSVGLVALVAAKIDRTYTNRIVLTFDRSIVEQCYKLRFE